MSEEVSAPDGTNDEPRRYRFTFGSYTQTSWTDVRSLTWSDVTTLLTTHAVGQKEGTCIVPAVFRGKKRQKADADQIDVAFLDSDTGHTLDEIKAAIARHGWSAIISSSHSHLATRTRVKRGNWDKFLAMHGDPTLAPVVLLQRKGYQPRVLDGAAIIKTSDDDVTFAHAPCPKFRVVLPLARPWRAADWPSQDAANAAWEERIEALAAQLGLHHDQSCTDTSRLFYLPRRPEDGPPAETEVLEGTLCDIFELARAPEAKATHASRHRKTASPGGPERRGRGPDDQADDTDCIFTDPRTGEVINLRDWARQAGRTFELRTVLQRHRPDIFIHKIGDGGKHHITCVNEDEHTQGGADGATFVVNASESANAGFVYHCRHAHCDGRDRLFFIRRLLEQEWLSVADLCGPAVHDNQSRQRPLIQVTDGELPALVDQAEQALLEADLHLYQRGGSIVRPGHVTATVKSGAAPRILDVGDHALREAMMKAAEWQRFDGRRKDWAPCDAPMKVATTYQERVGKWRLPVLAGIITAPTLRPDGTVLADSGYDAETGLLFDPGSARFPTVPGNPSRAQAEKALLLFDKLVQTFPFVTEADRSVMLAAILTASIRRSLRTAPLFGFTAPAAGSGKSLLVDLVSIITTGREASVIASGKTPEEFEKRLGSLLLSGDHVIAIDNCEAPLSSELLCSMLTQQTVRPRILGRSEAPELPSTALVTATGNNLVLVGDLTRRSLLCRLDSQSERPELRVFDTNPIVVAKAHRARLLVAALTVLRAYHIAGYEGEHDPLGSFDEWSRWVRGALRWLGRADPVQTMETARQTDPRRDKLVAVLVQWQQVIGSREVTARDVIVRAEERKSGDEHTDAGPWHPDLHEAIRLVAGDGTGLNSRRLGSWLAQHEGQVAERLRIVRGVISAGFQRWRVEVVS